MTSWNLAPFGGDGGVHSGPFVLHLQPVDAWHMDGWWTGVQAAATAPDSTGGMSTEGGQRYTGPEALAFPVGGRVEVIRLGDSQVMSLVANVEKHIWEDNLLVHYESMEGDIGGKSLRDVIHVHHVWPSPPPISDATKFSILEGVEAFYVDGWCAGVTTRKHGNSKYNVKSNQWEGEMEFYQSILRPSLQWQDGCWVQVQPSKVLIS